MQADNDNLESVVEGFDDWIPLHEAARKVVEACGEKRTHSHQVGPGGRRETDVNDGGRVGHDAPGNASVGSIVALRRGR